MKIILGVLIWLAFGYVGAGIIMLAFSKTRRKSCSKIIVFIMGPLFGPVYFMVSILYVMFVIEYGKRKCEEKLKSYITI